ncbi:unnamed protein product [Symbiodinium sp. KB8]|nr:unnamed protein product [Symbiodinium sp. KB8]
MSPFFGAAEGRWFRFLAGTSQRASQPAASVADAEGDSAAVVNAAAAVEEEYESQDGALSVRLRELGEKVDARVRSLIKYVNGFRV